MDRALTRRLGAEFLGTFVLVFVGCGTAILDAGNKGIDLVGVAIAFGIAVIFLYVIIGATDVRAPAGFAGIAIGFTLMIIHLVSIPVSDTSVNPARSTGPAIIQHGWALGQLWAFWVAPIVGAIIAGASYHHIVGKHPVSPEQPLAAAA